MKIRVRPPCSGHARQTHRHQGVARFDRNLFRFQGAGRTGGARRLGTSARRRGRGVGRRQGLQAQGHLVQIAGAADHHRIAANGVIVINANDLARRRGGAHAIGQGVVKGGLLHRIQRLALGFVQPHHAPAVHDHAVLHIGGDAPALLHAVHRALDDADHQRAQQAAGRRRTGGAVVVRLAHPPRLDHAGAQGFVMLGQIGARAVEVGVAGAGPRQVDALSPRRGRARDDLGLDRLCGHDQQAGCDCDTLHLDSPPRVPPLGRGVFARNLGFTTERARSV